MFQLHRLPVEKVADTLWSDKEDECPGTLCIVHVHCTNFNAVGTSYVYTWIYY